MLQCKNSCMNCMIRLRDHFQSDCSSVYFDCTLTEGGTVWSVEEEECATGMYFDPLNLVCDYPQNIPGCEDFVTTTT